MSLRLYLCPVIFDAVMSSQFPALDGTVDGWTAKIPCDPQTGLAKFSWCLLIARATDWTAADAVAGAMKLFDSQDLPDSINTFSEFRAFLQSKTVGDIPATRRQALNTKLTARGIDTSPITLQWTWARVLKYICAHLNDGVQLTGDEVSI